LVGLTRKQIPLAMEVTYTRFSRLTDGCTRDQRQLTSYGHASTPGLQCPLSPLNRFGFAQPATEFSAAQHGGNRHQFARQASSRSSARRCGKSSRLASCGVPIGVSSVIQPPFCCQPPLPLRRDEGAKQRGRGGSLRRYLWARFAAPQASGEKQPGASDAVERRNRIPDSAMRRHRDGQQRRPQSENLLKTLGSNCIQEPQPT
jgi:hypothetical protein